MRARTEHGVICIRFYRVLLCVGNFLFGFAYQCCFIFGFTQTGSASVAFVLCLQVLFYGGILLLQQRIVYDKDRNLSYLCY